MIKCLLSLSMSHTCPITASHKRTTISLFYPMTWNLFKHSMSFINDSFYTTHHQPRIKKMEITSLWLLPQWACVRAPLLKSKWWLTLFHRVWTMPIVLPHQSTELIVAQIINHFHCLTTCIAMPPTLMCLYSNTCLFICHSIWSMSKISHYQNTKLSIMQVIKQLHCIVISHDVRQLTAGAADRRREERRVPRPAARTQCRETGKQQ